MRRRVPAGLGIVMTAVLGLSAPTGVAAEEGVTIPRFEFARYGFAADATDATAIFLNPAGLAGGPGTNLYADITGNTDGVVEYSAGLQGKNLGFAYRHREPLDSMDLPIADGAVTDGGNLDSYILAGSFGPPKLKLGLSVIWNKTTLSGEDGFSWNAGFQSMLGQRFAIGGLIENIEHPDFLDTRLRPQYTYGVTVRVVPGLLTANVQGHHLDSASDLLELQYGVRVGLEPGYFFAVVMTDRPGEDPTFGFSATWYFGKGAVSGRAHTLSGNDDVLGQAAIQIYDEFWQQGTRKPSAPTMIGRRK